MNAVDRIIEQARETIRDFDAFTAQHEVLIERARDACDDPNHTWWLATLSGEERAVVNKYYNDAVAARMAERTLAIWGSGEVTMNHADRVIAEARQAIKDYGDFMAQHPEAPHQAERLEEAYRVTLHQSGKYMWDVVSPEAIDIVSVYQRLRVCAETAKHTLAIYGVEAQA